ncbi:MAG: beta-N-acetylhexosaminidase [Bacteroidales bacterium]|nr:beta-N-acetylhexosaminidase [Bacteroidales bacterium]MBR3096663.1 beta-N-acetylhexosaminidase [Bacteroidales bacterium]
MKNILLTLLAVVLVLSCRENGQPQPFSVIPMPNDVTLAEGSFNVAGALVSVDENLDEASAKAVKAFSETLETVTGKPMNGKRGGVIRFGLNPNMGTEEYFLQVKPDGVNVEASAFGGFFYAIQTLKQMLPAEVYGNQKANAAWLLPCVTILDAPRFDYRGIHMDPCRHFWSVEETKRYIDIAATYKLNRLHWHLTEDQGWRMEIKKYPKLTEVGAWRSGTCIGKDFDSNDGIRYGGFYTQDEMREIVAYAAERNITVIPEVDLPGHMVAALAAYPELGCTGGPYEVWTRWGVSEDVLCVGKEETFTFLEDVLTEVMDIFPSEYIHIGGDECPKDRWRNCPLCQARIKQLGLKAHDNFSAEEELQAYVTSRIQKFLNDHGRKIIGWDEILDGSLAPGATVMSWRGTEGGIRAAELGFDVVMTPNSHMYIDYYQSRERDKEPLCIGGYVPVEKVYSYEPYEGMTPGTEDHILGVQANLWTEYVTSPEFLEYMLLPRMCALSEVQWCNADRKDYTRFDSSLDHTFKMLDVMGYAYAKHVRGLIGLPGQEQPARSPEELAEYLENQTEW